MKECLREEVLQRYLDGELHGEQVEQVAFHLASCSSCMNLERQLEQENNFLATALAPEFEAVVPSERLRQRINSAIASDRFEAARPGNVRDWLSWISDLFAFRPQRALAYASLILIVGFGLIMGMVRWQSTTTPPSPANVAYNAPEKAPNVNGTSGSNAVAPTKDAVKDLVATSSSRPGRLTNRRPRTINPTTPAPESEVAANHVKLLPGERSYLQTIAQLDSTINADKTRMKPEVQTEYQRNLAVVDRTLAVARTAAKSNPNDPDAAEFMFSAYQSKVDLLNTVAEARVFDKQQ